MLLPNSVSIVLPLYNPKGEWAQQFINNAKELNEFLPSHISAEYIVVLDGPMQAETALGFDFIEQHLEHVRFISYADNKGKGYALRQGVKAAHTPYVLMVDFDFPYKKENILELLTLLDKGTDVVVGRRTKQYFSQVPFKRKFISKVFSTLNRLFLDLPLYDTQSGIKGFNQKGSSIFLQTVIDRFLVDTEFLVRVHKTRLSVNIIDIELRPHITFSDFGVQVIKTELLNFLKILRLSKTLFYRKESIGAGIFNHTYSLRA